MKGQKTSTVDGYSRCWILAFNLLALLIITSCSSSSNSTTPFTPVNSLEGKVIVLGAQGTSGDLVIYMHGTNLSGGVLTVADLQTATVNVNADAFTISDTSLAIEVVTDSDKFLSLSLITDWSSSTNGELVQVANIFTKILDNLPQVYEAQVITFSNGYEIKLPWSQDPAAIKAAVATSHSVSDRTALYDSIGVALEGDIDTDGLVDQCRTAHMQVVFTDGDDNLSSVYSDTQLEAIVNADKTVSIMLGTSDADTNVLEKLSGDHGAVVQVVDATSLGAEVEQWIASLKNIVKITVRSAIYVNGDTVSITMGSQTVAVFPNSHCP